MCVMGVSHPGYPQIFSSLKDEPPRTEIFMAHLFGLNRFTDPAKRSLHNHAC